MMKCTSGVSLRHRAEGIIQAGKKGIAGLRVLFLLGLLAASSSGLRAESGVSPDTSRDLQLLERYQLLLERRPAPGPAFDRLYDLAKKLDRTEQVTRHYAGLFQAEPEKKLGAGILWALFLEKDGALREALSAYDEVLTADPSFAPAALAAARIQAEEMGEFDQAILLLRQVLEGGAKDDPLRDEVRFALGETLLAAGEEAEAVETLTELLAEKDDPQVRLDLARRFEKHELLAAAADQYRHLTDHAGPAERAQACKELARLEALQGNLEDAITALEKGVSLTAPGNWLRQEMLQKLVRLHQQNGSVDSLKQSLLDAHQRAPRDLGALLDLRTVYGLLNDPAGELEWQEKIVRLAPQRFEDQVIYAQLLADLGDLQKAALVLDDLLERQPMNIQIIFARAELEVEMGEAEAAVNRMTALRDRLEPGDEIISRIEDFFVRHRLSEAHEEHLRFLLAAEDSDGSSNASPEFRRLIDLLMRTGQTAQAQILLEETVEAAADDSQRAALHFFFGQTALSQAQEPLALRHFVQATELLPAQPEYHLALGKAYAHTGRVAEARMEFEAALAATADPFSEMAVDADRAHFELLEDLSPEKEKDQAWEQAEVEAHGFSTRGEDRAHDVRILEFLPGAEKPEEASGATVSPLEDKLLLLNAKADEGDSIADHVRAARWLIWAERPGEARKVLRRALRLNGDHPAVRDLFLEVLGDEQRPHEVPDDLRLLGEAASEEEQIQMRQRQAEIAQLNGDEDRAISILEEIAMLRPDDLQLTVALALAQQQANRWYEALETWQRALDKTAGPARLPILRPLVSVLERVHMPDRAVALLWENLDEMTDEDSRLRVVDELIALSNRLGKLKEIARRFQERLENQPNNLFYRQAMARVYRAQGDEDKAMELMADATLMSARPAKVLLQLADQAERNGDLDLAAEYLTQLLVESPEAEHFRRLARLQLRNHDVSAAAQTWAEATRRRSRDAQVFLDAGLFYQRYGESGQAADCFERLVELRPFDPRARLLLGQELVQSAHTGEAIEHLERALALTGGSAVHEMVLPPLELDTSHDLEGVIRQVYDRVMRLDDMRIREQVKRFWRPDRIGSPSAAEGDEVRLAAIRELAQIRFANAESEPEEYRRWITRWSGEGSFTERLWAFYYARSGYDLWLHTKEWGEDSDTEGQNSLYLQAFIWLNLELGNYERLGKWLHEPSGQREYRRQHFWVALGQLLESARFVPSQRPDFFELFTREGVGWSELWFAADLLTLWGDLTGAARLYLSAAERSETNQAESSLQAARLLLQAGETTAAEKALEAALSRPSTQTVLNYATSARLYHLLQGQGQDAFAKIEALSEEEIPPAQRLMAELVIDAMDNRGYDPGPRVRKLLAERPGIRPSRHNFNDNIQIGLSLSYWNFVYVAGLQLIEWRLDDLGVALWDEALRDSALVSFQGDESREELEAIEKLMVSMKAWQSPVIPARKTLQEYFGKRRDPEDLRKLATQLDNVRLYQEEALVLKRLRKVDPASAAQTGERLFRLYLDSGELELAQRSLEAGEPSPDLSSDRQLNAGDIAYAQNMIRQENFLAMAHAHVQFGQLVEAQELLTRELADPPYKPDVLRLLIQVLQRRGFHEEAIRYCRHLVREEPMVHLWMAESLAALEREDEAVNHLESVIPGYYARHELLPALAKAKLRTEDVEGAFEVAGEFLRGQFETYQALELADAFKVSGRPEMARTLLQDAAQKQLPAGEAGLVLKALVTEYRPDGADYEDLLKHLRRWQEQARLSREAMRSLDDVRFQVADEFGRLPQLAEELEAEWRREPDDARPAILLARVWAEIGDTTRLDQILTRYLDDLSGRRLDQADELSRHLLKEGYPERALRIVSEARELSPAKMELRFLHGEILLSLGRKAEAREEIRTLRWHAYLMPVRADELARRWKEMGDAEQADLFYRMALPDFSIPGKHELAKEYVTFLRERGQRSQARHILRQLYRSGAYTDAEPLLSYLLDEDPSLALEETASGDLIPAGLGPIDLSSAGMWSLRVAVFERYRQDNRLQDALRLAEKYPDAVLPAAEADDDFARQLARADWEICRWLAETRLAQSRTNDARSLVEGFIEATSQREPDAADSEDIARARAWLDMEKAKEALE